MTRRRGEAEVVRPGVKVRVEREGDGLWHGWVYRKVEGRWFVAGAIAPRATEGAARGAVLALAGS